MVAWEAGTCRLPLSWNAVSCGTHDPAPVPIVRTGSVVGSAAPITDNGIALEYKDRVLEAVLFVYMQSTRRDHQL